MLREFRAILGYKRSHSKQTDIQASINAQSFAFFSYSISEVGSPKSSAIVFGLLLMYREKGHDEGMAADELWLQTSVCRFASLWVLLNKLISISLC